MKKEDIVIIRIVSAAVIFAALAALLTFGFGSGLFISAGSLMKNGMNTNNNSAISIYSIYYYKGANIPYTVLYSAAVFSTIAAAAGFILKYRASAVFGKTAALTSGLTGIYVLLCCIFEKNKSVVGLISGIYLKTSDDNIEVSAVLGMKMIVLSIIVIILSVLAFLLISAGGLERLKLFKTSNKSRYISFLIPVIYSSFAMKVIRELFISAGCERNGSITSQVYTFVTEYSFKNMWYFNLDTAIILAAVLLVFIICEKKKTNRTTSEETVRQSYFKEAAAVLVFFTAAAVISGAVFCTNPPALFGYLTLDEAVCDATEAAYIAYIAKFIADTALIIVMFDVIYMFSNSIKKILTLCALHLSISIAGVLICVNINLSAVYIICFAADILALVACFYIAYISCRNHRVVSVIDNEAGL